MPWPRVRFTVRRTIVAVAISAIAIGVSVGAVRTWEYSGDLRRHAAVHGVAQRLMLSLGNASEAEYHALMRRKYEDTAQNPWKGGYADAEPEAGNVRVTVEILPKPDGEPYEDGEQIRCKGRVSWHDVAPPEDVKIVLQTGLFPDKNFPKCNEKILPMRTMDGGYDTRSGNAVWEGSIRANRMPGVEDYIILAYPFAVGSGIYVENAALIRGSARLRIPK
jgi:hypothetical protein